MSKKQRDLIESETEFYQNYGKDRKPLIADRGEEILAEQVSDEPETIKDAKIYCQQLEHLESAIKVNLELISLGREEMEERQKQISAVVKEIAALTGAINDFKAVIGKTLEAVKMIIAEYLEKLGENDFEFFITNEAPDFLQYVSTDLKKQSPGLNEITANYEIALQNEEKLKQEQTSLAIQIDELLEENKLLQNELNEWQRNKIDLLPFTTDEIKWIQDKGFGRKGNVKSRDANNLNNFFWNEYPLRTKRDIDEYLHPFKYTDGSSLLERYSRDDLCQHLGAIIYAVKIREDHSDGDIYFAPLNLVIKIAKTLGLISEYGNEESTLFAFISENFKIKKSSAEKTEDNNMLKLIWEPSEKAQKNTIMKSFGYHKTTEAISFLELNPNFLSKITAEAKKIINPAQRKMIEEILLENKKTSHLQPVITLPRLTIAEINKKKEEAKALEEKIKNQRSMLTNLFNKLNEKKIIIPSSPEVLDGIINDQQKLRIRRKDPQKKSSPKGINAEVRSVSKKVSDIFKQLNEGPDFKDIFK